MNDLIILDQQKLTAFKEQMTIFVKSGFLPDSVNTPQKAFVIAQKGRELGIAPMEAFSSIHIIKGKPTLSADLMLGLILKRCPQAIINFEELTNEKCVIEATRDNRHKPTKISFTIQDAQQAGLAGGHSWKKYPRALLRSRAISEMARTIFPDALIGCGYTPEEIGGDDYVDATTENPTNESEPRDVSSAQTVVANGYSDATLTTGTATSHIDKGLGSGGCGANIVADTNSTHKIGEDIPWPKKEEKFEVESLNDDQGIEKFTFTFGQFVGQSLEDIGEKDLGDWVRRTDLAEKTNKLNDNVIEAREIVEVYLRNYAMDNK